MSRRVRVAFCLVNGGIGGTELNAVRTAERLDRSRFDIQVIALDEVVSYQIAVGGQPDDYLLTVPEGQKIFVDLQKGANNLDWTLFDPAGQPVFGWSSRSQR